MCFIIYVFILDFVVSSNLFFGRGSCQDICDSVDRTCDMSPLEDITIDDCTRIFTNEEYTTVGSPTTVSDEWKNNDGSSAAEGWLKEAQSPCTVEDNGRLWFNTRKDSEEHGWLQCDVQSGGFNNQICFCQGSNS